MVITGGSIDHPSVKDSGNVTQPRHRVRGLFRCLQGRFVGLGTIRCKNSKSATRRPAHACLILQWKLTICLKKEEEKVVA